MAKRVVRRREAVNIDGSSTSGNARSRAERTRSVDAASRSTPRAREHFHEGLTDETTRLRFFMLHPHLGQSEVARFTHVDHHDREALVALDGHDIIAVGRYDRLPGTDAARRWRS